MLKLIEDTFNVDGGFSQVIAVILALTAVLLLFGLFVFILKRLMGATTPQSRSRQPRIAVMDSATVDTRRRLVLVRRDNVEHLLLVGGPSDVVVEQNIIRNAPLAAGRPGAHALAGTALATSVKSPMAPGPEIPPRPEDLSPAAEAAPLVPALQAKVPVPAASPEEAPAEPPLRTPAAAASVPKPPAAPVTARQPAAESLRENPFTFGPTPAKAAPAPAPTQPPAPTPAPAPAAVSASGRLDIKAGARSSHPASSRAADLLRAATQNGFNRATSKSQPQAAAPAVTTPSADEDRSAPKAPEVRAEPVAAPEDDGISSSKTASPLRSLTRPFAPRERPSYGSHSITPPASGPAARAKTALQSPVETAATSRKVEPVIAPMVAVSEAAPAVQDAGTQDTPGETTGSAGADAGATVSMTAKPAFSGAPSGNAEPLETSEETTANDPETVEIPEPLEVKDTSPAAGGDQDMTASRDEPAPAAREIELDIEDLIADELTVATPEKTGTSAAPADQEGLAATAQAQTEEAVEEPAKEEKTQIVEVTSSPKPGPGLGDKNPIEEEMAKILDELGSQSNA
ncbi:flagellar biosynthetic protein FliO [Roseibium sp.]|uniref:flagellar biosynthetic protein FliO n=2 Tax=Roseibium sp. TaxID=1936156 RepID=UPI003D0F012F